MDTKALDLQAFEENLHDEWLKPDETIDDPMVIIESHPTKQNDYGNLVHIYVVSEKWPESSPVERSKAIRRVLERVDPDLSRQCTLTVGLNNEEAKQLGLTVIFSHPDFDINKPHTSEEFKIG